MKSIVERLRDYDECHDGDIDEAADMLEFFFNQMQMMSPKMNGQHSYRLMNGWPITYAVGDSKEDAIRQAIAEVNRSKTKAQQQNESE